MAAEAEIERFLVRYMADTSQATKAAGDMVSLTQQTTQQVQAAGANVQGSMDQTGAAVHGASFKIRDLRKGLGLLAATSIIPPEASAGVFKLVVGFSLASKAANIAAASMGTFKAALIGTGVGTLVVLLGELASWLVELSSKSKETGEAASNAFMSMASGGKRAKEALADIRVDVITKKMKEAADAMNPGIFRRAWNESIERRLV